jgi:hypothetical protein
MSERLRQLRERCYVLFSRAGDPKASRVYGPYLVVQFTPGGI